MKETSSKIFWQTTLALTFLADLGILLWSIARWNEIGVILYRSVWGLVFLMYLAVLAGCAWIFFHVAQITNSRFVSKIEKITSSLGNLRHLGWILFAAIVVLIPYLKFTFRVGEVVKKSTQDPVLTMILFYWAVWWLILLAAAALKVALKSTWQTGFITALLVLGLAYELFIRAQAVSSYPLSMGWSEASRYYYASLYFANSIYGESFPLSTLHPSRYFLQSLAFLVPGGLEWHRLWQLLLWVTLTGASAWVLAARTIKPAITPNLSPDERVPHSHPPSGEGLGVRVLFAAWLFLFFLRIGVYYHLQIMLIAPLLFVSPKHPWRSLAAIMFASAWAGVSRVNWFPVPAMIAIAIYLLETPFARKAKDEREKIFRLSPFVNYLAQPFTWSIAGLLSALAAQAVYIPLSGNAGNEKAFTSSFTSDLLWDRLWPNDSYPLGVLPAVLIVAGPLLAVLLLAARRNDKRLHPLRWAGLWLMLALLFGGSLIVSVKIGGGGDLHNMDAFAALLSVVAAYFIGDKAAGESAGERWQAPAWPLLATGALIPLAFLLPILKPFPHYNQKANQQAEKQLVELVNAAAKNGPVLFINERELVTFGKVQAALVPEYEAVTLMEMAMSGNQAYLERFYTDLRAQRFAAIVAGKQNLGMKDEGAFAEENNIWNTRVSPYILCYYQPATLVEAGLSKLEFFVPRATPENCP